MDLKTALTTVGVALMVVWFVLDRPAGAQYFYETPDGHQTIGSAQMYQQPSQAAPGKTTSRRQNGYKLPPWQSGTIVNQANSPTAPGPNLLPNSRGVVNSGMPQKGSTGLPQGEFLIDRTGPIQPVTPATRVILGAWLLLQLVVIAIVAFAMQFKLRPDERRLQGDT